MAPDPAHHPWHDGSTPDDRDAIRQRAIEAHPAGRARRPADTRPMPMRATTLPVSPPASPEDGSMTTEYGLLVVVGATICSLVIRWAGGGAVFELLDKVVTGAGRLLGL